MQLNPNTSTKSSSVSAELAPIWRAPLPRSTRLGNKLQRLARLAPGSLQVVEDITDEILLAAEQQSTATEVDLAEAMAYSAGGDVGTVLKNRRGMAVAWRAEAPSPGWNARTQPTPLQNPRPPAVPASLDLTLEEYYTATALMGILSAQEHEPDIEWAAKWAADMGAAQAREMRKRRKSNRR